MQRGSTKDSVYTASRKNEREKRARDRDIAKTALESRESQDLKYSHVRARRTESICLLDTVRLSSLATGLKSVYVYFLKYDFPRSLEDLGPLLAAIKKPSFDVKNVNYLTSKILLITSEAGF